MTTEQQRQYRRTYYEKHRDKIKARSKKTRLENKEKLSEYNKKYRLTHKDKQREYQRTWEKENPDKIRASYQKHIIARRATRQRYKKLHPEKSRIYRQKRRIKSSNSDITTKFLSILWETTSYCVLCGKQLENHGRYPDGKNLDHILPLNVGGTHTKNNVRYICAYCNMSRPQNGSDVKV